MLKKKTNLRRQRGNYRRFDADIDTLNKVHEEQLSRSYNNIQHDEEEAKDDGRSHESNHEDLD